MNMKWFPYFAPIVLVIILLLIGVQCLTSPAESDVAGFRVGGLVRITKGQNRLAGGFCIVAGLVVLGITVRQIKQQSKGGG